jgi:hypothetical protein
VALSEIAPFILSLHWAVHLDGSTVLCPQGNIQLPMAVQIAEYSDTGLSTVAGTRMQHNIVMDWPTISSNIPSIELGELVSCVRYRSFLSSDLLFSLGVFTRCHSTIAFINKVPYNKLHSFILTE